MTSRAQATIPGLSASMLMAMRRNDDPQTTALNDSIAHSVGPKWPSWVPSDVTR